MKRSIILLLITIIFFYSCKKDELTLPSPVLFKFGMVSAYNDSEAKNYHYYQNAYSPYFLIESGVFVVDAIEFDGKREEGKDIYFISDFSEPVVAALSDQKTNFDVEFDIPQGVYKKIDIVFHINNSENIPLILEGVYKGGNIEKKIRFEYNHSEQISVRASNKQEGQNNIILRKDKQSIAFAIVDADYIFRFIGVGQILNAQTSIIDGEPFVIINSQNNIDIYNNVASRLNKSITVVFE